MTCWDQRAMDDLLRRAKWQIIWLLTVQFAAGIVVGFYLARVVFS